MATSNDLPIARAPVLRPLRGAHTLDTGAAKVSIREAAAKFIKKTGTYKFLPLDDPNKIRILKIFRGKKEDKLKCMLFTSTLKLPAGQTPPSPSISGVSEYWALSYWWGEPDEEPKNLIRIYNDTGGRDVTQELTPFNIYGTFYIRDNLKAALERFREEQRDVNVWVDALCINQDDKIEKKAQVARMHEIYTQAEMVCIWLGEGKDETPETFTLLQTILDLRSLDSLVKAPMTKETARKWELVVKLMTNRWFSRRWILQELALSRRATVKWGDVELSWLDFADAIALFMTKYEDIKRCLDTFGKYKETDARALGAHTIVHATINLFRKSQDGRVEQRLIPLEILVSSLLLAFEASEPRDTIFAVLTLAKDSHSASTEPNATKDERISPDYEKCLVDVYTDFMDYCITKSKSLDIICRYWAPPPNPPSHEDVLTEKSTAVVPEEMPSWIPLIGKSAFGDPRGVVEGRMNGDSFVGGPERKGQQTYNASAGLKAWHKFGLKESEVPIPKPPQRSTTFPTNFDDDAEPIGSAGAVTPPGQRSPFPATNGDAVPPNEQLATPSPKPQRYDGTLAVRGFCLDIVKEVSDRVGGGKIIHDDALKIGGWDPRWKGRESLDKVPDKLWRTLVADRGPNGTSAPGWYRRACFECLQFTDRRGDLDMESIKKEPEIPSTLVTFLERVQPIVWGRRFFDTTATGKGDEKRLLGLGNFDVKRDDLVCILFGCSVPVLLRPETKEENPTYSFVGECYIHGMMDGEAIASKYTSKHPQHPYDEAEEFKLV
ncbi:HET-domain-containing protein [Cadophora sp. DSE1049]|nr:HET-domain-containing protein [Cadophora sp. DSE1049]